MVRVSWLNLVRFRVLAIGVLFLLSSEARAGSMVTDIGLYGGSAPFVEIKYTGDSGAWEYADARTVPNWTNADGSPNPLYCIDLQHGDYTGRVSFFDAVHQRASYLNQGVAIDPASPPVPTPEPASVVSSSIGAVSVVLLVWLRRIRSSV